MATCCTTVTAPLSMFAASIAACMAYDAFKQFEGHVRLVWRENEMSAKTVRRCPCAGVIDECVGGEAGSCPGRQERVAGVAGVRRVTNELKETEQ